MLFPLSPYIRLNTYTARVSSLRAAATLLSYAKKLQVQLVRSGLAKSRRRELPRKCFLAPAVPEAVACLALAVSMLLISRFVSESREFSTAKNNSPTPPLLYMEPSLDAPSHVHHPHTRACYTCARCGRLSVNMQRLPCVDECNVPTTIQTSLTDCSPLCTIGGSAVHRQHPSQG